MFICVLLLLLLVVVLLTKHLSALFLQTELRLQTAADPEPHGEQLLLFHSVIMEFYTNKLEASRVPPRAIKLVCSVRFGMFC